MTNDPPTDRHAIGQRTLMVTLAIALTMLGATAMVASASHKITETCERERDSGFVDTMYAVVRHTVCAQDHSDGACRLTYTWTFDVDEWGAPETIRHGWSGSYYWYDDGDAQYADHLDEDEYVVEEQGVPAPRTWTETWDTGWWNVDSSGDKLWGWSNGVFLQSVVTGEEVELGYGPKVKCTG